MLTNSKVPQKFFGDLSLPRRDLSDLSQKIPQLAVRNIFSIEKKRIDSQKERHGADEIGVCSSFCAWNRSVTFFANKPNCTIPVSDLVLPILGDGFPQIGQGNVLIRGSPR